jgi:fructokinase
MTKSRKQVVVGIGEILWDMLPAGKQLGGAPANFACFAGVLGANAYVVSCIGADDLGLEISRKLKTMQLSDKYVATDTTHPTGVVAVDLDEKGKPTYDIKRNAAWDFIQSTPLLTALAKKTDAVCYGTLAQRSPVSRRAICKFIKAVPKTALKILDINLRQAFYSRKIIHDLLKISNILKINDEELAVVGKMFAFGRGEKNMVQKLMTRYKLKALAVTKGAQGAAIYLPNCVFSAKCGKVKVIDTVGAGDAFTGGLAVGLLNGLNMKKILVSANKLAGYVCSKHGATPPLPRKLCGLFTK